MSVGTLVCILHCYAARVPAEPINQSTDQPPTHAQAVGVSISFQGAVVGNNLAAVLIAIYETAPEFLNIQPNTISGDKTICGLLHRSSYPPPCEAYLPLIDRINKAPISTKILQTGDVVSLPSLSVTSDQSLRVFSKLNDSEVIQGNQLLRNWQSFGARRIEGPDSFGIRFNTYNLLVAVPDDKSANTLFDSLVKFRSPNVLVNLLTNAINPPPSLHSGFPDSQDLQNDCTSGALKLRTAQGNLPLFRYSELMDGDQDALPAMKAGLSASPVNVSVMLVDTTLSDSSQPALDISKWACKWRKFVSSTDHANHLRGIIESMGPLHLFEGMSDHVNVWGYSWWKPADDDTTKLAKGSNDRGAELAGKFDDSYAVQPIPIYVVATNFEDYSGKAKSSDGQLLSPEKRYVGRMPEQAIARSRPLLIVSAGQSNDDDFSAAGTKGVAISATQPMSPQNLGDFENVIVVTACRVCGGDSPQLFPQANYSTVGQHMVHIAAPGAQISGWVDGDNLSAAGGTSQSVALVAGLAASMISQFPNTYNSPHVVKTRLQETSRPMPPSPDSTPNPDAIKLAAGIVDPILALLNPAKHWLKQGGKWREVAIRKWSTDNFSVADTFGQPTINFKSSAVLGVYRTHNGTQDLPTVYSIYVDALKNQSLSGSGATVDRFDFIGKLGTTTLVLCDNSSIPLNKIDDLLVRAGGIGQNQSECP